MISQEFAGAAESGQAASLPRSERAYQQLRAAIQAGQLSPGTRLREVELAESLGLSRTPVREALSRLESEGLVVNEPNRGMMVTQLDASMVSELYVMREVLEGTAAALAARHATDVEISLLRDIVERDLAIANDPDRLALNNRLFHETLHRCAHNRYLLKTLRSLHESMALLGRTTLAVPGRARSSYEEHISLVEALEQRDPTLAEQIARRHIQQAYKVRLSLWIQEQSGS
ncbi:putative transcriptional regulator, HTH GntR [Cupriavidus phytorum]|uniref:Transcriptional regulator, HTH GntR n=2 Tax=Cupriavidus TaxID=106589 RepID=A0A976AAF1_9BURK|nr:MULTISPECIES: GntR family transcriptional regulator [Cupriavidus]PZX34496.1 GntR family transcriptional regulator [Cupriavidus alkaliphilus]SOY71494.1 putative transcriptional regulator, HTH GntR [Cupriavidus taiwanensis]